MDKTFVENFRSMTDEELIALPITQYEKADTYVLVAELQKRLATMLDDMWRIYG